ncbi:MAG: DegT/DnrJ/EryC1/StrS family aminotransferase [Ardenticatenaceae bacterium]|nr:DegT/DnrJ/EryC1/StrS family aminotransferase [Ardenticatenaceae bacterium]
MCVPMFNLRAEYEALRDEIDAAIQRVIDSGSFVLGEEVEAFEAEFARYCGARYAVGVGSGTAALHLGLMACGIGPGDEVITAPNSDNPTTMTLSHCGATIVWADIDRRTFNLDPARIEEKITGRTRAILPVHLFGHPADMDPIMEIARHRGLLVIEDAALAVGAEYKGRRVGTIGDVGCISLAPNKILGAYGDAGIIITNRKEIADRIKVLRNYGHSLEMEAGIDGTLGIRSWELVAEGFNERLDTLQAAILRAKLPTLEDRIARRREVANQYNQRLASLDLVTPYEALEVRHVYRAYTVVIENREQVRDHLAARGIASRLYYSPPLHLQPTYAHLGFQPGAFPVTEEVAAKMLALPLFPEITDEQIMTVVSALEEWAAANPAP